MPRAEWGSVAAILADDDTVWRLRHLPQQDIAKQLRISRYALSDHLRPRGWGWRPGGAGVGRAPCRECGLAFQVDETTVERVCQDCTRAQGILDDLDGVSPNVRLCREEYAKRAHRIGTLEWNWEYRRIGGPEWGGRRRAAA